MKNKTLFEFMTEEPTLFSGLALPSGMQTSILQQLIEDSCGMMYPWIQLASRLKADITNWCTYRLPAWTRAYGAMTEVYDPLHNYNKEELGSEEYAHHRGSKHASAFKSTDKPGTTVTTTGSVVAYNSGAESETGKSVSTPSGTGNVTEGLATDNYETWEDIDANTYDKDTREFINRITRGNIGVTKSQDMAADEVRLRMEVELYELIAAEFESKFMMQVY